jgi:hypothetical protein
MIEVRVGDRLWFLGERIGYTVHAVSQDRRYAVATKPFAARHTYIYTLIDWLDAVRGVDDSLGNCLGYGDREQCEESMRLIESGEFGFSHRRKPIPLHVTGWRRP